jgi:hypothetical protein
VDFLETRGHSARRRLAAAPAGRVLPDGDLGLAALLELIVGFANQGGGVDHLVLLRSDRSGPP